MEPVITGFKMHIGEDEEAGGHADRQAEDIDNRKNLIPEEVPPGDLEIVPEHRRCFLLAIKGDAAIVMG